MATAQFNVSSVGDYRRFLAIKSLPKYRITGRTAWYPDEYAEVIDGRRRAAFQDDIELADHLFDYQADISRLAARANLERASRSAGERQRSLLV